MGQIQSQPRPPSNAWRVPTDTGMHSPAVQRGTPMADAPTPDRPAAPSHRRQLIKLVIGVVILAGPLIAFGIASHSDTSADLCDLLRSGWTGDEIVASDQWRDWPDSMSTLERQAAVLDEAGDKCPEQVGL